MLCHVWPGITPMNVWDLTWGQWLAFSTACDEWVKIREKGGTS